MATDTLANLAPATAAVVTSLDLEFPLRERLFALGLRVGRTISVVRRFGRHGPLQVRVDHTDVILRGAEAARIQVGPVEVGDISAPNFRSRDSIRRSDKAAA